MNASELWGNLLTLKELFVSHVTRAASGPILVFPRLCVLDLDSMHASDRQTSDAHGCFVSLP